MKMFDSLEMQGYNSMARSAEKPVDVANTKNKVPLDRCGLLSTASKPPVVGTVRKSNLK